MQPLSGLFSRPCLPVSSRLKKAIVQEHTCPTLSCGHFLTCWNSMTGSLQVFSSSSLLVNLWLEQKDLGRSTLPPPGDSLFCVAPAHKLGAELPPCSLKVFAYSNLLMLHIFSTQTKPCVHAWFWLLQNWLDPLLGRSVCHACQSVIQLKHISSNFCYISNIHAKS